jgi:hypothetical protein
MATLPSVNAPIDFGAFLNYKPQTSPIVQAFIDDFAAKKAAAAAAQTRQATHANTMELEGVKGNNAARNAFIAEVANLFAPGTVGHINAGSVAQDLYSKFFGSGLPFSDMGTEQREHSALAQAQANLNLTTGQAAQAAADAGLALPQDTAAIPTGQMPQYQLDALTAVKAAGAPTSVTLNASNDVSGLGQGPGGSVVLRKRGEEATSKAGDPATARRNLDAAQGKPPPAPPAIDVIGGEPLDDPTSKQTLAAAQVILRVVGDVSRIVSITVDRTQNESIVRTERGSYAVRAGPDGETHVFSLDEPRAVGPAVAP